jgi:hypothetical protein
MNLTLNNIVDSFVKDLNQLLSAKKLSNPEIKKRLESLYLDPDLFFAVDCKLQELTERYFHSHKNPEEFLSLALTKLYGHEETKVALKEIKQTFEEVLYDYSQKTGYIQSILSPSESEFIWRDVVSDNTSYETDLLKKHFFFHIIASKRSPTIHH